MIINKFIEIFINNIDVKDIISGSVVTFMYPAVNTLFRWLKSSGLMAEKKHSYKDLVYVLYLVFNYFVFSIWAYSIYIMCADIRVIITYKTIILFTIITVVYIIVLFLIIKLYFRERDNITICLLLLPFVAATLIYLHVVYNNIVLLSTSGILLVFAEIAGMSHFQKFVIEYIHKYADIKLINGESIYTESRTMHFYNLKNIIKIDCSDFYMVIPYSQVVKIQYSGERDRVKEDDIVKIIIGKIVSWLKQHKKNLK